MKPAVLITGALSYSGRYMAKRLIERGYRIKTLTNHPERYNPFGEWVEVYEYRFEDPGYLKKAFEGVEVFYNTYWIRFPRGEITYERAVENTRILIKAAEEAGVRRMVHISITNADKNSDLPYFRCKGEIEEMIKASTMSYAIIRPTVIFSTEDILINNIAWFLRHFPVFLIPGDGKYMLQPVYVEDLADIAVEVGESEQNIIIDAVGPEKYTFEELVRLMGREMGLKRAYVHVPPWMVYILVKIIGLVVGDVILTWDKVKGLMKNLLVTESSPTGKTLFSRWLKENVDRLGKKYHSELERHYAR